MKLPLIPVSFGELIDKFTILQIKNEKIKDNNKLDIIKKEINYLEPIINTLDLDLVIINDLKIINETLWILEDSIREKENKKEFDNEFIEISRMIYKTNDNRNKIKANIDKIFKSEITDIKSYITYK